MSLLALALSMATSQDEPTLSRLVIRNEVRRQLAPRPVPDTWVQDDRLTRKILDQYPMAVHPGRVTTEANKVSWPVQPTRKTLPIPNMLEGHYPEIAKVERYVRADYAFTPKSAEKAVR